MNHVIQMPTGALRATLGLVGVAVFLRGPATASAEVVPPTSAGQINQQAMVESGTAAGRANKRLVFDFWREVIDAGHLEAAPRFLAADYIQHNPNVPTGLAGFVRAFSGTPRTEITAKIREHLIAIVAERDRVVLIFAGDQSGAPGKRPATFDMFRIAGGRIAEHWDDDPKE